MTAGVDERGARKMKVMMFQAMSPAERLEHFDEVSDGMCSDDWRGKFSRFIEGFPPDIQASHEPLVREICDHSTIEGCLFKKSGDLPGCRGCRDAFWKLVNLAALDW
jgi:hypothetical protein